MCGGLSDQPAGFGAACLVFPPCAGVIGKTISEHLIAEGVFPPCAGLSVVLSTVTRWLEVFPPCAGVIGRVVHGYPLAGSIPPHAGGYRRYLTSSRKAQTYSPRMRGLSPREAKNHRGRVFPRVRGLSVTNGEKSSFVNVFPRMRGLSEHQWKSTAAYSPRMRGLSAKTATFIKTSFVFPRVRGLSAEID